MRTYSFLALLSLLIAGCAASVTKAYPTIRHNPDILQWGLAGISDVQTLDPALVSDPTSISIASLVYGGLVRFDTHLHVVPDGASSWTISRDGLQYTFSIRPNLRFADGNRVTAQDFADALNRALGPEGSTGAASFYLSLIAQHNTIHRGNTRTVRGITVLDRSTLRITLTHPAAHFLAELAFPVSFVPDPRLLSRYGPNWTDHASGFGPFVVREWQHTRFLRLVPNTHYYGGVPRLKGIVLHFYGDTSAIGPGGYARDAGSAYKSGALDMVSGMQAGQSPPGKVVGMRRVPALALDYLAFNTARLPFFRLNARRAFASVWSPAFASSALGRGAFPAHGFVPSAFGLTSTAWRPQAASATYLAIARYPHGHGFPPVSMIMPRDSGLYTLARELRQAWKTRLGITVTLRQLNTSNYSKVLTAHAFDLALVEWGGDYPDPQDFLGTQLGSSSDNVTGWTKKPYEGTIVQADAYSPLDSRRSALFRQAADLAASKVPLLPLDEPAQTAIIRPNLTNVSLTPLGTIVGDWANAKLQH